MSTPLPLQNTESEIEQTILEFDVGNIPAAVARAERLAEQYPENHPVLCLAAAMVAAENRFPDAQQFYQRSLAVAQSAQDKAKSWAGLGKLGMLSGNRAAAEESGRRAMLADPAAVEHAINFAEILAAYGKLDPAVDVLRSSMKRFPRDPDPCIALGSLLIRDGRHRDALAFYDMALQRDPNASAAHFNASVALTMLGKVDAARTACENALKISPEMAGYYQLANLGGLKADDPRIPALESRADDSRASRELRIDAGFALALAFDAAGDADKAFPQLWRANVLKRSTLAYDIREDEDRIAKISSLFTADFLRRFAGASTRPWRRYSCSVCRVPAPRSWSRCWQVTHSRAGGELPYMAEIARGIGRYGVHAAKPPRQRRTGPRGPGPSREGLHRSHAAPAEQAALHRQVAGQLHVHRPHPPHVPGGTDHPLPSRPGGHLPEQLSALFSSDVPFATTSLNSATTTFLPKADGPLGRRALAGTHPGRGLRIDGGGSRDRAAPGAGFLRPGVRVGCLDFHDVKRHQHRERGAGPKPVFMAPRCTAGKVCGAPGPLLAALSWNPRSPEAQALRRAAMSPCTRASSRPPAPRRRS